MESLSVPNSPSSPTSNRAMVWRLSSSTGSITTSGSSTSKSNVHSTGRGGSGNIRRHSVSGDGISHTSTQDSSAKSVVEEVKDDVVAPKGLEMAVSGSVGIKSSGRGGSGNINGSRRLLQLFGDLKQPNSEELEVREREVLAAHRAKKLAQASVNKATYGRGGLGNLPRRGAGVLKSKKGTESLGLRKHVRRRSSSLHSRRSSSSSIKRRNQKESTKESAAISESTRRSSVDSFSFLNDPNPDELFFVDKQSPAQPIASTSRLPSGPPPPLLRPAPKAPLPPIPALESPPSPLLSLRPPIPNRPLNMSRTPLRPTSPSGSQYTINNPQRSRVYVQRQSAGGGAEWRLVTQVREERRGTRKYIIEEPIWELYSKDDIRREKQEVYEMKMMNKWVEKGKKRGWVSDFGDGYVSEPA